MGWRETLRGRLESAAVVDETQPAAERDYQLAVDRYLRLIPHEKILSIYRIGSVGTPGLSDIDLLIVLKDDRRDNPYSYSIKKLNEQDRYLFGHECELVNRYTFENLPLWFPVFTLDRMSGEEISVNRGYETNPDLHLMLLVKFLVLKLPAELILYSFLLGTFHERICEGMTHSVLHALTLWERSGGSPVDGGDRFVRNVASLRSSWFEMGSAQRRESLRATVVEAMEIILRLQSLASAAVRERWLMEDFAHSDWELPVSSLTLSFTRNWQEETAIDMILSRGIKVLPLPGEFSVLPLAFTKSDGLVGKHLRNLIPFADSGQSVPENIRSLLSAHVAVIENLALFYARSLRMPAHGYHTFGAPHSRSRVARAAGRVRNRLTRLL